MIGPELEAQILRLYHAEKWRVGTLARQLGVHHSTVRRVLAQAGVAEARYPSRPSQVDAYLPFMLQTLERYPSLPASRLWAMVVERGYPGGEDHFRSIVARLRPKRPAEAYLRLRTLPGEQAQVDWADFGKVKVGSAERRLAGFVMVLSYSRMLFLRFFWDQRMPNFLRAHAEAFARFGGVPRVLLYDNLRSAVLERRGDAIRFNPELLRFAAHYRYEPRPVAKARGNEKGRVERAIRYVRDNFFAARTWLDLGDLNRQADAWSLGAAAKRACPEDRAREVREVFDEERGALLPRPEHDYPVHERVEVSVGRTPYVRFDRNDYSVPHTLVRSTLSVVATPNEVRVLHGGAVVARHERSYDKGQQLEQPEHLEALVAYKQQARKHRGMDRLRHAAPASQALLGEVGKRGGSLGGATRALLRLLDEHGARLLEEAIVEALERGAPHPHAVGQVLERRRKARNLPPPVAVVLPDDPRVRSLAVRPQPLSDYDKLTLEPTEEVPP
jgi:transposase